MEKPIRLAPGVPLRGFPAGFQRVVEDLSHGLDGLYVGALKCLRRPPLPHVSIRYDGALPVVPAARLAGAWEARHGVTVPGQLRNGCPPSSGQRRSASGPTLTRNHVRRTSSKRVPDAWSTDRLIRQMRSVPRTRSPLV